MNSHPFRSYGSNNFCDVCSETRNDPLHLSPLADVEGSQELLPCPFCGKVPDGRNFQGDSIWHTGNCRIAGFAWSPKQWNTRSSLDASKEYVRGALHIKGDLHKKS